MTRVRCDFLKSEVPDPCPRKTVAHGCIDCQDEITERSAILQYGQGTGWRQDSDLGGFGDPHAEVPTARSRAEADEMARAPVVAAMREYGRQTTLGI